MVLQICTEPSKESVGKPFSLSQPTMFISRAHETKISLGARGVKCSSGARFVIIFLDLCLSLWL